MGKTAAIPPQQYAIILLVHVAEFLFKIGVVAMPKCLICGDDVESHLHLFFNWYFSKPILSDYGMVADKFSR